MPRTLSPAEAALHAGQHLGKAEGIGISQKGREGLDLVQVHAGGVPEGILEKDFLPRGGHDDAVKLQRGLRLGISAQGRCRKAQHTEQDMKDALHLESFPQAELNTFRRPELVGLEGASHKHPP